MKTEVRTLEVTLTDAEVLAAGRDLAKAQQDLDEAEQEKKDVAKELGEAVAAARKRVHDLTQTVSTGKALRAVKCDVIYIREKLRAVIVRQDTGEQIEVRPMTEQERQRSLVED